MKKRWMALWLCVVLMAGTMGTRADVSAASTKVKITMNGKTTTYKGKKITVKCNNKKVSVTKVPVLMEKGYALTPYYDTFKKKLYVKTSYNSKNKKLTMTYGTKVLVLTMNKKTATLNGKSFKLPVAAREVRYIAKKKSRILVPSKIVAEKLGFSYSWSSKTNTITINRKGKCLSYGNKSYEAYTSRQYVMYAKGVKISSKIPGLTLDGKNYVSAKYLFKNGMGAYYKYDSKTKKATIKYNDKTIVYTLNSPNVTVNGKADKMTSPMYIVKDEDTKKSYVLVPVKYTAKILGLIYSTNKSAKTISVSVPMPEINVTGSLDRPFVNEVATQEVKETYTIKVPRPTNIPQKTMYYIDDYANRQMILTLAGLHKEELMKKGIINNNSGISSYAITEAGDQTKITFKTSKIRAWYVEADSQYIYITVRSPKEIYKNVIVVDAGHGGSDSGATGNGLYEKTVNLNILLATKAIFDQQLKYKVYYTRVTDKYIPLAQIYGFANEVDSDIFICIHNNSATASARGTETLYPTTANTNVTSGGLNSKTLANYMQNNMVKATGTTNRKTVIRNGLAVLRGTKMPAVLVECAFVSNTKDAAILKNQEKIKAMGKAIYDTVDQVFTKYPNKR